DSFSLILFTDSSHTTGSEVYITTYSIFLSDWGYQEYYYMDTTDYNTYKIKWYGGQKRMKVYVNGILIFNHIWKQAHTTEEIYGIRWGFLTIMTDGSGAPWREATLDYFYYSLDNQEIEGLWESKDITPYKDHESELRYIYCSLQKQTTGYMEIGYRPDYETTFTTVSFYMGGDGVLNKRIPIPAGEVAKTWRFRIREISDDSNFEVHELNARFKAKPLR
ncbi:MAG: hypothetical protein ACTSQY_09965, partial [Candidatus Odinarchaeia archaeon]